MKSRLLSFLAVWLLLPFFVSAQRPDTSGSAVLFQKLMAGINPKHVRWVKTSAKTANERNTTETETRNMAVQYANLGALNGADIEALVFLVMMQAAKDAQEDLKAIMAKVKNINNQKAKLREVLAKMNERNAQISRMQYDSFTLLLLKNPEVKTNQRLKTAPTNDEREELLKKMQEELESQTERSQEESLRLQTLTDRITKILTTISNILKKIARSAEEIIKNMKG